MVGLSWFPWLGAMGILRTPIQQPVVLVGMVYRAPPYDVDFVQLGTTVLLELRPGRIHLLRQQRHLREWAMVRARSCVLRAHTGPRAKRT